MENRILWQQLVTCVKTGVLRQSPFAPAKLHLIVGPNGAGKSTLIKVFARLLRPQVGKVEYEDIDVGQVSEAELRNVARCFHRRPNLRFR